MPWSGLLSLAGVPQALPLIRNGQVVYSLSALRHFRTRGDQIITNSGAPRIPVANCKYLGPTREPESTRPHFDRGNDAKACFEDVYDADTPAGYLGELAPLDYRIPDEAAGPIGELVEEVRRARGVSKATVLDVGCSYGINAAVLKYRTSFRAISERYPAGHAPEDGRRAGHRDRSFYRSLEGDPQLRVVGLDVAPKAIAYGLSSGLLDDAITANLETDALSPEDAQRLGETDLVISTGCVGYVTEATFAKLIDAIVPSRGAPIVASFVLRMFPYDAIRRQLGARGYVTEKRPGTFRQRRFKNGAERTQVLSRLAQLGLNPNEAEAKDGYLHAELFVSRAT